MALKPIEVHDGTLSPAEEQEMLALERRVDALLLESKRGQRVDIDKVTKGLDWWLRDELKRRYEAAGWNWIKDADGSVSLKPAPGSLPVT